MTSDQPGNPGEPAPPDRHDQPLPSFPTSLGTSEGTTITLLGQDLARDLMGHVSFGELAYWLITLRRPTPQQSRLFEAVLLGLRRAARPHRRGNPPAGRQLDLHDRRSQRGIHSTHPERT